MVTAVQTFTDPPEAKASVHKVKHLLTEKNGAEFGVIGVVPYTRIALLRVARTRRCPTPAVAYCLASGQRFQPI